MSARSPSDPGERLFVAWLHGRERGEGPGIEGLCERHPEHAETLARLHAQWRACQRLLARLGPECAAESELAELLSPDELRVFVRLLKELREGGGNGNGNGGSA